MLPYISRNLILKSNEKMNIILAAVEKTLNISLPLFVAYDYDDHYSYSEEDQVHMTEVLGYEITFSPWSVIDETQRYFLSCHPGPKLEYLLDEALFNTESRKDISLSMALFLRDGTQMDRNISTEEDRVMIESAREKI